MSPGCPGSAYLAYKGRRCATLDEEKKLSLLFPYIHCPFFILVLFIGCKRVNEKAIIDYFTFYFTN